MFIVERKWRRWAGQRNDLLNVASLAADVLATWSDYEIEASVSIELRTGLTQRSEELNALRYLDREDLRRLDSLTVTLRPSRAAWQADAEDRFRRAAESDEDVDEVEVPELPNAEVEVRVWRETGVRLMVAGSDRTRVEGLAHRLAEVLGRTGSRVSWEQLWPLLLALPIAGVVFGGLVPAWLGFKVRGGFMPAEVVGLSIGIPVSLLLTFGVVRAFPHVEVLDQGQLPRTRRVRRAVLAAIGALLLGVIASALYDVLT